MEMIPESIDNWKADVRLELGADHWNEGGQDCTEEPEGLQGLHRIAQSSPKDGEDCTGLPGLYRGTYLTQTNSLHGSVLNHTLKRQEIPMFSKHGKP